MRETFSDLLHRLYVERYTGPVVLQFGQGVPNVAEIPQPSVQIRLDKPARLVADLTVTVSSRL